MRIAYLLMVVGLATACASGPEQPIRSKFDIGSMRNADAHELCIDYSRSRNPDILRELRRRENLNNTDVQALTTLEPRTGMTALGATCLYGYPIEIKNAPTTGQQMTEQWVYCRMHMRSVRQREAWAGFSDPKNPQCGGHAFLYVDGNKVTGLMNVVKPDQ